MSDKVMIWLLFEQDGAFLLARRKATSRPFPGMWTLPGDQMRFDESASETVERFTREELGAGVHADEFIDTFFVEEGGQNYAVTVFKPLNVDGTLRYRESGPYEELRWALPTELPAPIVPSVADVLQGKRHWRDDTEPPPSGQNA